MLQLGLDRPDLVDSGVSDWNEELHGADQGRLKPFMSLREQVDTYKYQAWLPGNCVSIRLAFQLASDAAVFKTEISESEWYYPLLKPYVHYIPITANETDTNIPEQLKWAENNPEQVKDIVEAANKFAATYLSNRGRDCFFLQLLSRFSELTTGSLVLPNRTQTFHRHMPWV